jgi:hypothetical protein
MGLGADNFSTFLSTLSKGLASSTAEPEKTQGDQKPWSEADLEFMGGFVKAQTEALIIKAAQAHPLAKRVAEALPALTPTDAILAKLAAAEQGLPISALVVPPLVSPGAAIEAVKEMQGFGLVQLIDGLVQLTAEGQKASRQISAQPGP